MSSPFSLSALLHVKWTTMPPELKHNLLFRDTNIAWREICKCLGLPHSISKFLPIRGHPDFTPDLDLQMYQLWETKGLRTFADLCDPISGSFLPFQEIITKYSLPSNHIFFLKQCYHFFFLSSLKMDLSSRFKHSFIDSLLHSDTYSISLIYKTIFDCQPTQ